MCAVVEETCTLKHLPWYTGTIVRIAAFDRATIAIFCNKELGILATATVVGLCWAVSGYSTISYSIGIISWVLSVGGSVSERSLFVLELLHFTLPI